jgi:iron complex transport system substrate-binding protein
MNKMTTLYFLLLFSFQSLLQAADETPKRIITLSSALTETTDALGLSSQIVATDVTSEYPAYVKQLPKVSQNRSLSVEGVLMYRPDIVLAPDNYVPRNIIIQLKKMGIEVVTIKQEFSLHGAEKFIREVAAAVQLKEKGELLIQQLQQKIAILRQQIKKDTEHTLKVLFIYARGVGTMTVAGKGSNMDAIIQLAGARNAIQEFSDFKPYSTEALIKANPDVILLFDFGARSLGGKTAILKMPGIQLTNAGKQKRIVEVEGPLMVNFSTRLPDAIKDLHAKLYP